MSKPEPARPNHITDKTKLNTVIRAQQGNNDFLQRKLNELIDAHNSLVDDVKDLKNFVLNQLDTTESEEQAQADQNFGEA